MIKICAYCGQKFETNNGRKRFCDNIHYKTCVICGSQFEVTRDQLVAKDSKTTCSKACTSQLRKQTNLEKYGAISPAGCEQVQAKMKATSLDRYGVEHPAQSQQVQNKMKATSLERYGVEFYTQSEVGKDAIKQSWKDVDQKQARLAKIKNTNLNKYGVECVLSNSDIRKKSRDTYYSTTGYLEPFSNPETHKKSEITNLQRYGVRHPLQSKSIQAKQIATCLERYGVSNPMQNINVLNKAKATCLERYGNTCYLQSDLGKQVTAEVMCSKYDHRWFSQSNVWKASRMLDPSKLDEFLAFKQDPARYAHEKYVTKPTIKLLAMDLGVHENTVGQILIENDCADTVSYVYSYMEDSVYNMLTSIDSTINIERNTRRIITPYELDLYLPKYNLGIECNPTSTHNSSINTFDSLSDPVKHDYHLMKTELCESKGILLFHIFSSEWAYSQPIIESMIRNLLGKCNRRIYARNCAIHEIDAKTCSEFLNANHRQGNANSPIRLGLFLDKELVSVMTFGKMRATIGTDKTDLSDCYELVRFCSLLNTSVVGGASKLFKYFLKNYHPTRVRSFSDRAHTRGGLYEKLGFTKIRESTPGYVWVDSRTDISYHRYSSQKQNIKRFLHDDSIDLSKTEKQIMEEHGFLQVYDCGTITWEYTNQL